MRYAALGMAIALLPAISRAADPAMQAYPTRSSVKWMPGPPALPTGARMAVLAGDPSKPGPFVIRLRLPAHYAIPPHHHPTTENVTVIAGALFAGMGDKVKKDAARPYVSGGFLSLPAQMNHFAWTKQMTVIQIEAEGPFAITYVNPADDPS
jgi:quercetin dioxygenase-like cupin family protein